MSVNINEKYIHVKTTIKPDKQNCSSITKTEYFILEKHDMDLINSYCCGSEYLLAILLSTGVSIFINMLNGQDTVVLIVNAFNNDIIFPLYWTRSENESAKSSIISIKKTYDIYHKFSKIAKKEFVRVSLKDLSNVGIVCRKNHREILSEYADIVFCLSYKELLCTYDAGKYTSDMITAINQSIMYILKQIVSQKDIMIAELQYQEIDALCTQYEMINSQFMYQTEFFSMKQLFEETARCYADNTLFIFPEKNEVMSYGCVNRLTNQYARLILSLINKGTHIGILVQDPLMFILMIVSSFKANCPYVPLNEEWPSDYRNYIISDSKVQCIITDFNSDFNSLNNNDKIININLNEVKLVDYEEKNLDFYPLELDVFNIIYTSGSTGQPKGVYISQRGISNFALWARNEFEYNIDEITMQCNSKSFDAFGANLFPQMISGSSIVVLSEKLRKNLPKLSNIISNYAVTNFALVPSMLRGIMKGAPSCNFNSVKFVILGGEHISKDLLMLCKEKMSDAIIINQYGTTEATIVSSGSNQNVSENDLDNAGKLVANTDVYFFDQEKRLVPLGLYGELFIGASCIIQV